MLSIDQLTDIIARGEKLDAEFKSDRRNVFRIQALFFA